MNTGYFTGVLLISLIIDLGVLKSIKSSFVNVGNVARNNQHMQNFNVFKIMFFW